MIKLYITLFLLVFTSLVADDKEVVKRVHAHLIVKDYYSACEEARSGINLYPNSILMRESSVKAFARAGCEKEMFAAWEAYVHMAAEPYENNRLIEEMAWAVIRKGATSPSPPVRMIGMVGALFGQDAQSIDILLNGLNDSNALIRQNTLQLVSNLHDIELKDRVYTLFQEERSIDVLIKAISAIGKMKIHAAKNSLLAILSNDKSRAEVKAAAIEAILELQESIDSEEIQRLATSSRAGLRQLACEIISFFDCTQDIGTVILLLKDHCPEVRARALLTLGRMRVAEHKGKPITEYLAELKDDRDSDVSMMTGWVMMLHDPKQGYEILRPWLNDPTQETRIFAASLLGATGKYGMSYAVEIFDQSRDPYVQMNLALAMASQHEQIDRSCQILFSCLEKHSEKWMWKDKMGFHFLAPSDVVRSAVIPYHPESVDQMVRLEIFNILAILKYPNTIDAIKKFLKERNWGVTASASALLLLEGDDSAVELVESLLQDKDPKVRIQAALILSLWGKGDNAINTLKEAYSGATRDMKERILEGLGRVGVRNNIPFLLEKLQEPYAVLRIIAAAALLQTLYH
jgi:HEAT repeat protein